MWYRGSENPLKETIPQVLTTGGDIHILRGGIVDGGGNVYFVGSTRPDVKNCGLYVRTFQKGEKSWSSLEKLCDCKVEDIKIDDRFVLVKSNTTVVSYSWDDNSWKPKQQKDGVRTISEVRAFHEGIYSVIDSIVYSSEQKKVIECAGKILDMCIVDEKMGVVDTTGMFTVYNLAQQKSIYQKTIQTIPLKVCIIPK